MDNRYKRLGKNTLLVFVGNASSKLIGLLLLPFYTRYLSPDQYGITDMIAVYASIMLPIVSACVADGIFIFPKDVERDNQRKYFTSGLGFALLSFFFCSLIFYGIDLVCELTNHHSTFTNYIWWIFAMTLSNFLKNYLQQFCRSIDKMVVFSSTGIVETILMALFAILWVPSHGIEGYFWSLIAASLLSSVYCFVFAGSYKYVHLKSFDKAFLKELLAFGLPLIPNSLMWWLVNGINRPIMESNLGLDAIGIYSVAHRFPSLINLLFTIFTAALGISMIEEYKKPDFASFFNKMVRLITVLLVLGGILLSISSKILVTIFATPDYFSAWRYIPLLTLSAIFQCISSSVGSVFTAAKQSKYFFYSSIWGTVASLLCTYLFIIMWGLIGVCLALVVSFLSMLISRFAYSKKYVEVDSKPFAILFLIYLLQVVIVTMDISSLVSVLATIIALLLVVWQNRTLIYSIKNQIKR